MRAIEIVSSSDGDWEGLYLNGELKAEGHSLNLWDVFEAIGLAAGFREVDSDWLNDRGNLPTGIAELPQAQ
jgi:hypothetical protein